MKPFITYSGDILTDIDLQALIDEHFRCGNDVTLALRKTGLAAEIALKNGRVVDIENKYGHAGEYDFANVSVWNPKIFQRIPPAQSISFIPILADWIGQGGKVGGVVLDDGKWFNIGSRAEYLEVHRIIQEERWKPDYVSTPEWPVQVAAKDAQRLAVLLHLGAEPPAGVFYNRMSASSHTRDHRYGAEYAGAVLAWLARHGRRVVNGERALQLEISKVAQYEALARFGIPSPPTIAVVSKEHIARAAGRLGFPLILKHNRGGKGPGVRLFLSAAALAEHLASPDFVEPVDGITLVQRYVKAPAPFITRVEFVGGRFLYAVRVDTSQGFELCPADAVRWRRRRWRARARPRRRATSSRS